MKKIAFLGLGVMGYPMAGHLIKAGHDVCVYNRTTSKAQQWAQEYGGNYASTPKEAVKNCDIAFACVGNDQDLHSVTLGSEGAFQSMPQGSVFVDHTTASANIAKTLYQHAKKAGFHFLDAPISGGQSGAEQGCLTIMVGGDEEVFSQVQSIFKAYSKKAGLLGQAGSGQLTKMVNQICIAGIIQGLAEGIHFAHQAGLDVHQVMDVIAEGAAGSWQMKNRHHTMDQGDYDHGFAIDWMRKDLGICLEEAQANQAQLPVTALVDQFYAEIQAVGGGRWDTSALLTRLKPS